MIKKSMPVYLVGFMGAGKSAVGREMARLMNRDFVDLDQVIARTSGRSIPRIFAEDGETGFREIERETLCSLPHSGGPVVATGGGAMVDGECRLFMAKTGLTVWLRCSFSEICRRIEGGGADPARIRPLWNGDSRKMAELLERRTPAYAEADVTIDVEGGNPKQLALEIETLINARSGGADEISHPQ